MKEGFCSSAPPAQHSGVLFLQSLSRAGLSRPPPPAPLWQGTPQWGQVPPPRSVLLWLRCSWLSFVPWLQRRGDRHASTKVPITLSLTADVFLYQPSASLYNVDHFDGAFVLISQMRKQSCKYCAVIKMAIYCAAFWLLPAHSLISIPLPLSLCSHPSCWLRQPLCPNPGTQRPAAKPTTPLRASALILEPGNPAAANSNRNSCC